MAENSPIEWTDATWNPVAGCSIASTGCTNCYAMRMAARLEAMGVDKYRGLTRKTGGRAKWTGRVYCDEAALQVPYRWKSPRRVFVNSMSDLFHENVPDVFIQRVWAVMEETPHHEYQILTKRPARMRRLLNGGTLRVLRNAWLGTSVENSDTKDRIKELSSTPAVIRFVSFEPLIGPVGDVNLTDIAWAIVGGESGPGARKIQEDWVWEIERACRSSSVAFFFKQWGGVNKKATGRLLGGRTYDEMPACIY